MCLSTGFLSVSTDRPLPLPDLWSRLVVRVMSGRNHDFGNALANSFYSQDVSIYRILVPNLIVVASAVFLTDYLMD
jgi:hypothetical protein